MVKVLKEEAGSQPAGELEAWNLDTLVREGARRMLASAVELEVEEYLREHERERDAEGSGRTGRRN